MLTPKRKTLVLVASVILILLVLLAAAYYFLIYKPMLAAEVPQVLVSFGAAEGGPMYGLSFGSATTTPKLFQPSIVGSSTVIDFAQDASTTYYILSKDNLLTSDIYSVSKKKPVLVRLTDVPSLKYDLAYDAASHTLAYASGPIQNAVSSSTASSTIFTLNTHTGIQSLLGPGTNPTILPGGIMILAKNGSSLEVMNSLSGKVTNLLNINPLAPFAVSSDGQTLAEFNPLTKAIDYFNISQVTSASFEHETPISFNPIVLTYQAGKLYGVGESFSSNGTSFFISEADSSQKLVIFTSPQLHDIVQKLILIHE
jgi:hypothetical protein